MKIIFKSSVIIGNKIFNPNDVKEIDKEIAEDLIKNNLAKKENKKVEKKGKL